MVVQAMRKLCEYCFGTSYIIQQLILFKLLDDETQVMSECLNQDRVWSKSLSSKDDRLKQHVIFWF